LKEHANKIRAQNCKCQTSYELLLFNGIGKFPINPEEKAIIEQVVDIVYNIICKDSVPKKGKFLRVSNEIA
jgi:hypothetical protein